MMAEIQALHAAVKPIETLFVVDAMLGQDAVNTARAFNEALPPDRHRADQARRRLARRRGAVGAPRHRQAAQVRRYRRKLSGWSLFTPTAWPAGILGMGDILGLVEDARRGVDEEKAKAFARRSSRPARASISTTSKEQIAQMRKMGGLSSMMDKLPAQFAQAAASCRAGAEEKAISRIEGIINSMTPLERAKPEILKASRKRRIAAGRRGDGAGGQSPAQTSSSRRRRS